MRLLLIKERLFLFGEFAVSKTQCLYNKFNSRIQSDVITAQCILNLVRSQSMISIGNSVIDTVEPPIATTCRKRPPLLSDQFSKIPKVFKSNYYI